MPQIDSRRVVDVAVALPVLVVASPALLFFIAGAAVTSRSSPFFSQPRYGMNCKVFTAYKISTMKDGSGTDDERVTRFGKWLRKRGFDEWPQLFNVIKGDMSLFGPRPLAIRDDNQGESHSHIPNWNDRYAIRPGLIPSSVKREKFDLIPYKPEARLMDDLAYIDRRRQAGCWRYDLQLLKYALYAKALGRIDPQTRKQPSPYPGASPA